MWFSSVQALAFQAVQCGYPVLSAVELKFEC